MVQLAYLISDTDPEYWHWLGLAAVKGKDGPFLSRIPKQIDFFRTDAAYSASVFAIGRLLKGHVDFEKAEIFGKKVELRFISPAKIAIEYFERQCAASRKAVDTWCLIARRIGSNQINKDIRKKIGMLIWEARACGTSAVVQDLYDTLASNPISSNPLYAPYDMSSHNGHLY